MISDLLLLSGNDIPFEEAQLNIHHPRIKEIAYLGEENFFAGYQMLNFSKNLLTEEDKVNLEELADFDILIAILKERNAVMQKNRNCVMMLLALLFPCYTIDLGKDCIKLTKEDNDKDIHYINKDNFEAFKKIIRAMFTFGEKDENTDFNPDGAMASRIADKLKKRHQKLAEVKGNENQKVDIISRYVSILAIGTKIDLNTILDYTVYQLFDQIKRYELKTSYEIYIEAKMAGAKDIKDPEDWMKDIHSNS
jgi:hypothetical protein